MGYSYNYNSVVSPPGFLPVSEGTDDVRASIMLCSIRLSIRSCTQNVNIFCKFCAFLHLCQIPSAGFMHPTQKSTPVLFDGGAEACAGAQRLPLSYGMPSALGARELLDVKASTSREMMYGSILYTDPGMPSDMRKPKPKYTVKSYSFFLL